MDKRDSELDDLVSPLRRLDASDAQVNEWRRAIRAELLRHRHATTKNSYVQLAAALFAGFILGALVAGSFLNVQKSQLAEKENPNATIEYVFAKSE